MPYPRWCASLVLAVGMATLASCSATQVTTQWQDPSTTQIRFTKVLSLCITKDQSLRDAAEGELCRHMPRVECKPAYFAIPASMASDVEKAKALTLKEGFDGAVVVRVLDTRQQVTYVPATYGPTFWGYYGYAWPVAYDPGVYRADTVVVLEISIFSLARNQLIWLGTTETVNPKSLPDLVDDMAKAVRGELLKRDLIPPS
jgi:hypothetical protein